MKKLLHVYSFELGNYFKSKSYMISTILICVLAIIAISMPAIISAVKGGDSGEGDGSDKADSVFGESIALYDPEGIVTDGTLLWEDGDPAEGQRGTGEGLRRRGRCGDRVCHPVNE